MIIFNDTYKWSDAVEKPVFNKWSVSCHLRIIDLTLSYPDIVHIRPIVVVAVNTTESPVKTTCAETLGRNIGTDFNLEIKRTLWIEYNPDQPDQMLVASLKPKYFDGSETIYAIQLRHIMQNELNLIKPFIPEADNIKKLTG